MIKNLFDAFRDAMKANPIGSRREAKDRFLAEVRSDPKYLEMLADDYFERQSQSWAVRGTETNYSFQRTAKPREVAERESRTARVRAAVEYRIRKIILLDITLPNGKRLREATGAECSKAGGFFMEVARHIKPTQVVDKHLSLIHI